ncbi:MAG: T9SS type A sorting domain-containing protein [Cytophagales bacterium]
MNYFKIESLDFDGLVKPSDIAVLKSEVSSITSIPNPFESRTRFTGLEAGSKLCVRDLMGRVLESHESIDGEDIEIGHQLKSGYYLVEVISGIERTTFKLQKK